MENLVNIEKIRDGQCFKKRTGTYVYLRISSSSVRFLGLDPENAYGVCFNGNIAVIKPQTLVIPMKIDNMVNNQRSQDNWERAVGCYDPPPVEEA